MESLQMKEIIGCILEELERTREHLQEEQLAALQEKIERANRIFVAGAGRSLLMIRGMAMRLMHIGRTVYVVGETVTPAIEKGDLLIIASGSGSTGTLTVIAQKCKQAGAELALITTMPESVIGKMADIVVHVCAADPKTRENEERSVQPGGNTFEQCVLLIGDALVLRMLHAKSMSENNQELLHRHANLE